MSTHPISLTLYIAGEGPNSRAARGNLLGTLRQGRGGLETLVEAVEIVDVFDEPRRALEADVFLTPLLVVTAQGVERRFIGSLSDTEALLATLREWLGRHERQAG